MSLEKILERIQRDTQEEIKRINDKATAAADDIIKKATAEAEALRAQLIENGRNEAEARKQRIISAAKLDLRKEILVEKQKAIDLAFQKALDSLLNMGTTEYRNMLKKMIMPSVKTGNEEVILSERDKGRLGENFIRDINNQLSKGGKKGHLILSRDTYNMQGGFVLRRGKVELNSAFESLFKSSRDDLESEVSNLLFLDA